MTKFNIFDKLKEFENEEDHIYRFILHSDPVKYPYWYITQLIYRVGHENWFYQINKCYYNDKNTILTDAITENEANELLQRYSVNEYYKEICCSDGSYPDY